MRVPPIPSTRRCVVGEFGWCSGEFTSPIGGVKPPLHQIDLPGHKCESAMGTYEGYLLILNDIPASFLSPTWRIVWAGVALVVALVLCCLRE